MLNRFLRWLTPKPAPSVWAGVERDISRRATIETLTNEIARLKRNKKRHSHLQQELDSLNA